MLEPVFGGGDPVSDLVNLLLSLVRLEAVRECAYSDVKRSAAASLE